MKTTKRFKHSSTYYRKKFKLSQHIQEQLSAGSSNQCSSVGPSTSTMKNVPALPNLLHNTINTTETLTTTLGPRNPDALDELEEILLENHENEILLEEEKNVIVLERIRDWALKNLITHKALNELLNILSYAGISNLPTDSRTLLHTPKDVNIKPMASGSFWYCGVRENLTNIFLKVDASKEIRINFHIDGVPVNDSSRTQFWPILMQVVEFPDVSPQVVAIYCGKSKPPSAVLFFDEFVEELNDLLGSPMHLNGFEIRIKINYFICDTPARCFSKCVVSYNAYSSCHRCLVKGKYYQNGRHMSFPQIDCAPRTDEMFRQRIDRDHHLKDKDSEEIMGSPLELLPIDMVQDFPIADSLHLIDLGIMKRCLNGWVNGSFNFREKFFANQVETISKWLENCNSNMPSDIHRAARSLKCLSFWKGTEYRTFLIYLGPVILKNNLSRDLYRHFLLLFCAVTICSCKYYVKNSCLLLLADKMLKDYIELFITNYGVDSVSSNVHNLCHLVDDVKKFGHLSNISSYLFENKLGLVKRLLRSGNHPLSQVARRLSEISLLEATTKKGKPNAPVLKHDIREPNFQTPVENLTLFKTIEFAQVCLSANKKNQWFMTITGDVIKMLCAYILNKETYIYGCKIKKLYNFFNYPLESKLLNIYKGSLNFCTPEQFQIRNIKCKMFMLNFNEEIVLFPVLHTLNLFSM